MIDTKAIHILVIDDNLDDFILVEQLLTKAPATYCLEKARSLKAGLLQIKNFKADVILLDLSLCDSHGLATFEKIKVEIKNTPIIILTEMNDQQIAGQAVRIGAQDYLLKNELTESILTRSIRYAIERHNAEDKRQWLATKILYSQKLESLSVLSEGVASQFNSLLEAIMGNSDIAMKKMDTQSSAYRNVERIKSSALEAHELANQMLVYAGRGEFVVKLLDVSTLIKELEPLMQATLPTGAKIIYQVSKDLPLIKADVSQIKQLILSLMINATEALSGSGGVIVLRAKERRNLNGFNSQISTGTYLALEIEDNGVGLKETHLPRVFEPFYTTKFTGRGLGLTAAQGIVNGHGGLIKIENAKPKGALVTVLIPKIAE